MIMAEYWKANKIGRKPQHYVLIQRRMLGGYKLTPCYGHELKPIRNETLVFKTLEDMTKDWNLISQVNTESVYMGMPSD